MPKLAPKPCSQPGCRALVPQGTRYCDEHRRRMERDRMARRRENPVERELLVTEFLERRQLAGVREVSARDVMVDGLNLDPGASDYAERSARIARQVGDAIAAAGWTRLGSVGRGASRRVVYQAPTKQRGPASIDSCR